ncbi:MFS transporter [Streptomyces violascens]|uniref:MFS transporter n=1 Tax=Streptomyces violascens TaxID=67381 RepID=A0ABQ3QQK6_9ACTN|nr:MFS transporter [Streptomyces violascens]GGU20986.1 MFS transporter [Streptomyces violascens]GHI39559.1 MFS transporter [Streptomyces violascens]
MSTGTGSPSAPAPTPTYNKRGGGTFSSLAVRNYRLFFSGAIVSNIGTWMARITQDWLVLTITGSSVAVGITTAMQFLPMLLFGLYGGVIADRFAKRNILFVTQAAMGLGGLFLAVMTLSGHVQVWHVYLTAFFTGLVTVVDNPTRQSFVSEMVGPDRVRNAVSLNSANFQSARLVGPAVAGAVMAAVGPGWAFLANGLSFTAPLIMLTLMRTKELQPTRLAPRGKGQLKEGLAYVSERPELIWPIVLVGFVGTFGFNFPIWLSAFASDVFHGDSGMYGLFNSLMAIGSLIGALLAARRSSTRLRMLALAAFLFAVLELVASGAPDLGVFMALLIPVGILGLTVNVTANASVQMATDPEMRGRVMSLFMMVFTGGTPLGGPLFGWLTDVYGVRVSLALGGLICGAAAIGVGLMLARAANLRLKVDVRPGHRHLAFVPRNPALVTAA